LDQRSRALLLEIIFAIRNVRDNAYEKNKSGHDSFDRVLAGELTREVIK
jgi:hypothetical protein